MCNSNTHSIRFHSFDRWYVISTVDIWSLGIHSDSFDRWFHSWFIPFEYSILRFEWLTLPILPQPFWNSFFYCCPHCYSVFITITMPTLPYSTTLWYILTDTFALFICISSILFLRTFTIYSRLYVVFPVVICSTFDIYLKENSVEAGEAWLLQPVCSFVDRLLCHSDSTIVMHAAAESFCSFSFMPAYLPWRPSNAFPSCSSAFAYAYSFQPSPFFW